MGVRVQIAVFFGVVVLLLVPVGVAGALTKAEAGGTSVEVIAAHGKTTTVSARSVPAQKVEEQASAVSDPSEAGRNARVSRIEQVVERSNSSVAVSGGVAGGGTRAAIASRKSPQGAAPAEDGAEVTREELGTEERGALQRTKQASGGGVVPPGRELRIARQDIVARPVGRISKEKYKQLYKKSAEKYGFGADWYVLAAVGWVESRHGEDMGPSSSGAMGPMQFLPSTWKTSGVDGNHDGVKNIMDPRDAIPASARYLKRGGAPKDWFAALYTYNHSPRYVRDVLNSAERYRRLAKNHKAGL